MTPSERFRRNATQFTELIESLSGSAWSRESRCEGWTVADVVNHVITTEADFFARQPFGVPQQLGNPATVDDWPKVRDAIQAALDDPTQADLAYDGYFGPTTFAKTIDQFYSADLTVHRWDIAAAVGNTKSQILDEAEMMIISEGFAGLGDAMYQPGLFGPPPAVDDDASFQTKFLASLGRVG